MSAGTISTGRRGRSLRRFLGLVERRAGLIMIDHDYDVVWWAAGHNYDDLDEEENSEDNAITIEEWPSH